MTQQLKIHLKCRRRGFTILAQEDHLEKEMATHSSILEWEIPRTKEPGRLQSMGLQRGRHNSVTKQLVEFTHITALWKYQSILLFPRWP